MNTMYLVYKEIGTIVIYGLFRDESNAAAFISMQPDNKDLFYRKIVVDF